MALPYFIYVEPCMYVDTFLGITLYLILTAAMDYISKNALEMALSSWTFITKAPSTLQH